MTPIDSPATVVVHLDGQTRTVPWPRDQKLLDALVAEGIAAPHSCREGHCGSCAVTKVSGEVQMETNDVLDDQDLADGLILACQSRPVSDEVEINYDD